MDNSLDQEEKSQLAHYAVELILTPEAEVSQTRTDLANILSGKNASSWLHERIGLFRPLRQELSKLPPHRQHDLLLRGNIDLIKALHGEWRSEVKSYALENLILPTVRYSETEEDTNAIRDRLKFINDLVPAEALLVTDRKLAFLIHRLLSGRISFLTALNQSLSVKDWNSLFCEADIIKSWINYKDGAVLSNKTIEQEDYDLFTKRETIPIDAEEGAESCIGPLRDTIDATGFHKIVNALTKKIKVGRSNSLIWGCSGKAPGGKDVLPGEIGLFLERGPDYDLLLPVLIHETGHNLNWRLQHLFGGQEWFDRYAVSVGMNPSKYSSYAYSYCLTNKKELSDYTDYIQESFAEEFQFYWLKPEIIPVDRRRIFDEICDLLFGHIDREEMRKKILSVIGQYFGSRVDSIIFPMTLKKAQNFARRQDRIESENNRERLKQIIEAMNREEMIYWLEKLPSRDYFLPSKPLPVIKELYDGIKAGNFELDSVNKLVRQALNKN